MARSASRTSFLVIFIKNMHQGPYARACAQIELEKSLVLGITDLYVGMISDWRTN